MRALASAARQEIIDVLAHLGTVSVPELAQALDRPVDGLYYHLRILQKAGLVEETGSRVRNGLTQALYRARNITIDYEAARRGNKKALLEVTSSMLRLSFRDFEDAVRSDEVVVAGGKRELWLARKTGRLTKTELARLNRLIRDLLESVTPGSDDGQLYGLTVLLTPVNRQHRGPEAVQRPRSRKVR